MNEQHFAYKVRQNLNLGLHELTPGTLTRLESARTRALSRQKQTVSSSILATAGGYFQEHFSNFRIGQTLTALVLLMGVLFTTYWLFEESIVEQSAIDSELLSDDLPLGAFTDKGFATWLDHSAPD